MCLLYFSSQLRSAELWWSVRGAFAASITILGQLHPFPFSQPGCPPRRAGPTLHVLPAPWLKTREKAWVYWSILHDVAHDGVFVLCTFSNRSCPDRDKWCGPSGQAAWTVHHVQNHTLLDYSPPASQAVCRVGSTLYSLRLHWLKLSEDQMLAINHCEFSLSAPN